MRPTELDWRHGRYHLRFEHDSLMLRDVVVSEAEEPNGAQRRVEAAPSERAWSELRGLLDALDVWQWPGSPIADASVGAVDVGPELELQVSYKDATARLRAPAAGEEAPRGHELLAGAMLALEADDVGKLQDLRQQAEEMGLVG